tara:strand:- start:12 stop:398 length:387 start_codon:yes stop_codon:yes gene_type:complete
MAFGTLKADTLTHSTSGSLTTNYVVEGTLKHRGHYDQFGVTVSSLTDSLNNSSISDDGTGDVTVNRTAALANTGYSSSGGTNFNGTVMFSNATGKYTTTATQVLTKTTSTLAAADNNNVSFMISGDLA